MKKLLGIALLSSMTLLSACQSIKIDKEKPVKAEIYLVHSKLKAYETFPDNKSRDWSSNNDINDILKTFPEGSKPTLIHKTELSSNWSKTEILEEKNFLDATDWPIENKEWLTNVDEDEEIFTSKFTFKMTPKYFEDGTVIAEMVYNLQFLKSIMKVDDKEKYYQISDSLNAAKSMQFVPNKYYVFDVNSLENKSSLVIIYKLSN